MQSSRASMCHMHFQFPSMNSHSLNLSKRLAHRLISVKLTDVMSLAQLFSIPSSHTPLTVRVYSGTWDDCMFTVCVARQANNRSFNLYSSKEALWVLRLPCFCLIMCHFHTVEQIHHRDSQADSHCLLLHWLNKCLAWKTLMSKKQHDIHQGMILDAWKELNKAMCYLLSETVLYLNKDMHNIAFSFIWSLWLTFKNSASD